MEDATVVVTGASRGIGAAAVREFADAGARVVCCARDGDELDAVAADARERGGAVTAVRADVRDEYDVERLMEAAARVGGAIDVVVANAGVNHGAPGETPLHEESYSRFDDTMRTNARGVFATVKESVPHLAADARILVVSGSVARETKAGMGAYAVSKAAAEGLARGFRADLSQSVFVVDPGIVATDVTDGRGRDPADVAGLFRWAATDADPEAAGDGIVGLREWRRATR